MLIILNLLCSITHSLTLNTQPTTVIADSTITLHPAKAKELGVKQGGVVVVVGRRRRATYGRVAVSKNQKRGKCTLSSNMASNLRLRQDDKLKIVPLAKEPDDNEHRSGDLLLVTHSPSNAVSVTLSPIEDSIAELQASEGGDDILDDEIMQRFIQPYTEDADNALIKKGHVLTLTDANGKKLHVMVTHVELEGEKEEEEAASGKLWVSFCCDYTSGTY